MDLRQIQRLLDLAAVQHGLVSTRQAAELGVTSWMLRCAVSRGWLRPVRRGVYAVVGAPDTKWQRVMAASLAAGPDAVISHRSAAEIHGFHGVMADVPELTLLRRGGRRLEGVRVHRPRSLERIDIEERRGVWLTVPVRTVIDLAPTIGDDLLGVVLDEGAISRLWTAEEVLGRLEQLASPGRAGVTRLRKLLAQRLGEGHPDSRLEQRVFRVLRPCAPEFDVHYVEYFDGERIEMDLAWPGLKIDGEVDGLTVRTLSRTKLQRDLRRQNILAGYGWRIVHFTADMDDQTIVAQVTGLLPAR